MPPLRPNLVTRPRLLRRLDEGLHHGRPLTLVSAPAGYGKTTLVAAWLQQDETAASPAAVAWLSLDEDDNEPARFFAYLMAALHKSGVTWGPASHSLLEAPQLPPPDVLATTLLNELAPAADGRWRLLVLDDYHKIHNPFIHEALQFWLDHAPPALHLVLATREDPPLTLARWRARNQMTEIRAADLRFTDAEAADFLNRTMGLALDAADVAALEQRTEGWIAGLQLAAVALRSPQAGDTAEFIAAFSGGHHYVIDYLVEEVVRQQEAPVRDFLRQTAVLKRLSASLCDAVTGRSDSQAILAQLERNNLFLVPLDNERHWYRYHHLLADSLRAALDHEQRVTGHRRAAAWFADHELYAEAIDHAHAAGDEQEVARLVRLAVRPAIEKGEITQIAAWIKRLPQELVMHDPEFGVFWVLSLLLTGRSQEAPAALAILKQNSAAWPEPQQRARLLVLKAWIADVTGGDSRVALAEEAAAAVSDDDPLFGAFVSVPLGHAYLSQGRLPAAVAAFRRGLALSQLQGMAFMRLSLLGNLIHALNYGGRRQEAWLACQQALEAFVDAQGNPLPPAGIPYFLRAWLHYEANALAQARADAAQGRELLQLAFRETVLTPLEIELPALLHEAAGEHEQALAAVREGRQRAERQNYSLAARAADRIEADLHLRHGQVATVRRWAADLPIFAGRTADGIWQTVAPAEDLTYLTYARLLLAEERHEEAQSLLPLLAASVRAGERDRNLITVLLLQTAVSDDPMPYLLEAVQLAAAERYLRLLIDECAFPAHGPQLHSLLRRGAVHSIAPAFVDDLLAAVPATETAEVAADAPEMVEPLTDQETVVLGLLVAGYSNRQIAQELVISVGTAKWHVHNIYQKLGVGSRAEAIARAHAWQLIET